MTALAPGAGQAARPHGQGVPSQLCWAPVLLASRPFPISSPPAAAPFDRQHLTPTAWFDPSALSPGEPLLSLAEILSCMLGSEEAAASVLKEIAEHPEGAWTELSLSTRQAKGPCGVIPVGAFHRVIPVSAESQILLAWYGQRLLDLEGEVRGLRADLDQARRVLAAQEGALRQERARVESLLESNPEPVSIQDSGFRILAQNQAHQRLFGDRRGQECHQTYRGLAEPCPGCPMPEALASRETASLSDLPEEGPLAGERVHIRALPLFAPDNGAAGIVEIFGRGETAAVERDTGTVSDSVRLRDHELQHIQDVLERSGGNRAQAARLLGISRATLWRRLGTAQRRPLPPLESD